MFVDFVIHHSFGRVQTQFFIPIVAQNLCVHSLFFLLCDPEPSGRRVLRIAYHERALSRAVFIGTLLLTQTARSFALCIARSSLPHEFDCLLMQIRTSDNRSRYKPLVLAVLGLMPRRRKQSFLCYGLFTLPSNL